MCHRRNQYPWQRQRSRRIERRHSFIRGSHSLTAFHTERPSRLCVFLFLQFHQLTPLGRVHRLPAKRSQLLAQAVGCRPVFVEARHSALLEQRQGFGRWAGGLGGWGGLPRLLLGSLGLQPHLCRQTGSRIGQAEIADYAEREDSPFL